MCFPLHPNQLFSAQTKDHQLNYQYQKLKEEFQKSGFEHKDKIAKYFTAYMDMYDI